MGGTSYSYSARTERSTKKGYDTVTKATMDRVFVQAKKGEAHESMRSQGIVLREARDSDVHPNTFPVIFVLDVTGSMMDIPVMLIKEGLPKLVSSIIDQGVEDVTLLFMAVGDHETDDYPLQIGQFESGDEELDLWLTRTYPEKGGGANAGESYGLAYNFAAHNIVTDAWEKRGQKGVMIVCADEPALNYYPDAVMKEVTGNNQAKGFSIDEAINAAKEKWNIFHINPHNNYDEVYWKNKLGQNYISVSDYNKVPEIVSDLVCKFAKAETPDNVENESLKGDSDSTDNSTTMSGPGFL